ncbi:NAD(+)/NADH kinase [Clostridium sp. OS1-26]|uniref:ATP-NAD kinase family protein n=1 Tax=Clostridium sp. OS1-26 TaxID=3070681 RepID=UPI0027E21195|nr:NAD(+)/NADH kinase [Clostridium sp. OS1-26]WML34621.1 NAD(+)/NADH kinase [Clostridium sp. OS1-26]
MNKIGIIANPSSGKDIRRLVSHATTVDNNEKVNIVERIILAAQACGVSNVYIMPDVYQIGYKVEDNLLTLGELTAKVNILDIEITGTLEDTINATKKMEELEVDCIVVLGGDGTSRAVAKIIKYTPIIALSTGTNNVYPEMIEGTVAGMAAGVIASKKFDINKICSKDKRIEIYKDERLIDIALIDVVISKNLYVGSKAIWNINDILRIIVSKAHPASIGFSAIVGCKIIVSKNDDFGVSVDLMNNKNKIIAPVAAGIVTPIYMGDVDIINLNNQYEFTSKEAGTIALDGEREITFKAGERFTFKITRNGPLRVDIINALEIAQKSGFFKID